MVVEEEGGGLVFKLRGDNGMVMISMAIMRWRAERGKAMALIKDDDDDDVLMLFLLLSL